MARDPEISRADRPGRIGTSHLSLSLSLSPVHPHSIKQHSLLLFISGLLCDRSGLSVFA